MAFSGAIVGVAACTASGFVRGVTDLTITSGVLLGIAMGMVNSSALVLINHYFHEKRNIAYGLAVSGSPIGTVALSFSLGAALPKVNLKTVYFAQATLVGMCGALSLLLIICIR